LQVLHWLLLMLIEESHYQCLGWAVQVLLLLRLPGTEAPWLLHAAAHALLNWTGQLLLLLLLLVLVVVSRAAVPLASSVVVLPSLLPLLHH
jgi:hypothetical protein